MSLRRKIGGAKDLQGVVRTMKALAASNLGQYERSVATIAAYHRTVELALGACMRGIERGGLQATPAVPGVERSSDLIVFGSDQGLVGRFNEAIVDEVLALRSTLRWPPRVWAVGARTEGRLIDAGIAVERRFRVPTAVEGIGPLVSELLLAMAHPSSDAELRLAYHASSEEAVSRTTHWRLLPLDQQWSATLLARPWPGPPIPELLGAAEETLGALVREYVFISIFRACTESLASENARRLEAMDRAEHNIRGLLDTLQVAHQRQRQSRIDEELFDVIAGFDALVVARGTGARSSG
jgi:F-type H+-transporting ATPase subunit gamma